MPWILLALAIGSFALAMVAQPGWLIAVALLASLGLLFAAVLALASARIQSGSRSEMQILSPEELRALRAQAQARRTPDGAAPGNPGANEEARS